MHSSLFSPFNSRARSLGGATQSSTTSSKGVLFCFCTIKAFISERPARLASPGEVTALTDV